MIFIIINLYLSIGASLSDFTGSGLFKPNHLDEIQAMPSNIRRKPKKTHENPRKPKKAQENPWAMTIHLLHGQQVSLLLYATVVGFEFFVR